MKIKGTDGCSNTNQLLMYYFCLVRGTLGAPKFQEVQYFDRTDGYVFCALRAKIILF